MLLQPLLAKVLPTSLVTEEFKGTIQTMINQIDQDFANAKAFF